MKKKYIKYIVLAGIGVVLLVGVVSAAYKKGKKKGEITNNKENSEKVNKKSDNGFLNFRSKKISAKKSPASTSSKERSENVGNNKTKEGAKNNRREANPEKSQGPKSITINKPSKGVIWNKESGGIIKWSSSNVEKVDIKLVEAPWTCRGDRKCENFVLSQANSYVLDLNLKNTGKFKWPEDLETKIEIPDGKYLAEVSSQNGEVVDRSDTFAISNEKGQLEIKFPVENYKINGGINEVMTWTNPSDVFRMDISLLSAECSDNGCVPGETKKVLAENKISDGAFVLKKGMFSGIPGGKYYLEIKPQNKKYNRKTVQIRL